MVYGFIKSDLMKIKWEKDGWIRYIKYLYIDKIFLN